MYYKVCRSSTYSTIIASIQVQAYIQEINYVV